MSAERRVRRGPRLGQMLLLGVRLLRSYPGLAAVLYFLQLFLSLVAAWAMAAAMTAALGKNPLLDRAVDGDGLALVVLVRDNPNLIAALLAIALAAVILYAVISWFLIGGLIATYLERPASRRAVAERFGAGAAATFLCYARLWLWCLIPYAAIAAVATLTIEHAADGIADVLTIPDLLAKTAVAAVPIAVLLLVMTTAVDYARVDLSRHPRKAARRALWAGLLLVLTRVRPLAHSLVYGAVWVGITAVLALVTLSGDILLVSGSLWLIFARQLASALRFAARLTLVGGQVELARGLDAEPGAKHPADSATPSSS